MNADHWKYPLSSADPEVVNKSVAGMEASFRNAKLWGADSILLVPGVVDAKTSYKDAWTRSQKVIKERILPLAQQNKVIVGIEEVWNKFLLSPLEMARYVDEFGVAVDQGVPRRRQHALLRVPAGLGPHARRRGSPRIHVKDFQLNRKEGKFAWKNLGEGDVDWPEVRKALDEVGYQGWITTEINGGDAAYLKDVVGRLDKFFAGQKLV